MYPDFPIQLVESVADLIQHLMSAGREAIHARRLGSLGLGGPKPTPPRHARQHGIQRTGTQPVPVVVELFEHPLPVDALLVGVVQDVNLPEREEELPDDGIAHRARS